MTAPADREARPATLPELESLLLRSARRRRAPRFALRRWGLALAAGSLILAGGVAAAATGVFRIADGETPEGTYSIESRPAPSENPGSICLQLRYNGGVPAYGCGRRPTAARPFGMVIADVVDGSRRRVVYGLVSGEVVRVSVLGRGGPHADALTSRKPDLPGRFFSVVVPNRGRIALVGFDAAGQERARIGSLARPAHSPLSHGEAVAQGDPAGFAPAIAAPASFTYRGASITPAEAVRRSLACMQDRQGVHCYDSLAALEAAQGKRPGAP